MAEEEPIEVRFRLFDGTDIGPDKYDPSTTVTSLKETIIARWPQGEILLLIYYLVLVFVPIFQSFGCLNLFELALTATSESELSA